MWVLLKVVAAGSNKLFKKALAVDPAELGCEEGRVDITGWLWDWGGLGMARGAERCIVGCSGSGRSGWKDCCFRSGD